MARSNKPMIVVTSAVLNGPHGRAIHAAIDKIAANIALITNEWNGLNVLQGVCECYTLIMYCRLLLELPL